MVTVHNEDAVNGIVNSVPWLKQPANVICVNRANLFETPARLKDVRVNGHIYVANGTVPKRSRLFTVETVPKRPRSVIGETVPKLPDLL